MTFIKWNNANNNILHILILNQALKLISLISQLVKSDFNAKILQQLNSS